MIGFYVLFSIVTFAIVYQFSKSLLYHEALIDNQFVKILEDDPLINQVIDLNSESGFLILKIGHDMHRFGVIIMTPEKYFTFEWRYFRQVTPRFSRWFERYEF